MRNLSLLLPASLLLLVTNTGAQTLPYPQPDTAPISTVQVTAPTRVAWIRPDQARQIGGAYEMSNGWHLRVETARRYITATIDDEKPIRLIPVSRYKFVSGDRNVTMEFNRGSWGDEMMMSYVPDRLTAQVVVLSSRMAQR